MPDTQAVMQAAAGFTSAQKQALMGMRSTFLERLQGIIEQRRKIIFELHDSVPDSQSSTLTDVTIAKVCFGCSTLQSTACQVDESSRCACGCQCFASSLTTLSTQAAE